MQADERRRLEHRIGEMEEKEELESSLEMMDEKIRKLQVRVFFHPELKCVGGAFSTGEFLVSAVGLFQYISCLPIC